MPLATVRRNRRLGFVLCLALLLPTATTTARAGNQVWTGTGPRAKGIEAIARDPITTTRYWAASFGAGVYRSLDGGATWTSFRNGLTNTYVRCIAPNPRHPDSLLCGTNDGVFLSTDGGVNWTQKLATTVSVRGLAWHPQTAVAYAATYGLGVFKSVNGGATWFASNGAVSFLTNTKVRDVVLHPTNPQILYAATSTGGGVQRSLNAGIDWAPVPDTTATLGAAEQLQFDALNPQRIYVATLDRGVLRSSDGGNTWVRVNRGLTTFRGRAIVVVDTLRYLGTDGAGVFYTSVNDSLWHTVSTGLSNLVVDALFAAPASPATVWAGTDGSGIFDSTNRGASWSQLDGGLLTTFGFALAVRASSHVLYDGSGFGDQFWRSADQNGSWTRASLLFTHDSERAVVPDPVNPLTLYMTAYGAGVYKSTNDGATWANTDSLGSTLTNRFVRPLVAYPGQSGHLFVGAGNGVYESVNGGTTWVPRSAGLPAGFSTRSLALVPGTPPTLYAGSDTAGVWKSLDGGVSWARRSSGLGSPFVHALLVSSLDAQTLFAGTDTGLFKSTNGGTNWVAAGTGLPAAPSVRTLAQDPVHPYALFCGVWGGGVFETRNGGVSWQAVFNQAGLTSLNVYCLAVDGALRTLYAGSDGGVAALSNYSLAVSDAGGAALSRLALVSWPNPAPLGRARLSYSLVQGGLPVRLDVYGVDGRWVRTLERRPDAAAGTHELNWDGTDRNGRQVPSGVYFVRLVSGRDVRTARVVVSAR